MLQPPPVPTPPIYQGRGLGIEMFEVSSSGYISTINITVENRNIPEQSSWYKKVRFVGDYFYREPLVLMPPITQN